MCATRSAAASAKASRNIAALDLLRWCSAALVWAYHAGAAYLAAPSAVSRNALTGVSLPRMLVGYSWFGWIGVEIFFILSGYVIARSAEGSAPGAFIRRRALRLLPAAWLCASLSAACVLVAGLEKPHIILDEWAASAFFLSPLDQIDGSWWTLGLEVDFYLLVALCLWGGRRWPLRWLPAALTLACAGFWLYRWMGHSAPRDQWGRYTDLALLRHGAFFALGMLMERRLTGGLRWPDWLTAAAALGACAYEIYDHADERARAMHIPHETALPLGLFLVGLVIVALAHRWQAGPRLQKIAATLGLMTYPFYLFHQDVGAILLGLLRRAGLAHAPALMAQLALLLAMTLAITLWAEPLLRRALAALLAWRPGGRTGQPAIRT